MVGWFVSLGNVCMKHVEYMLMVQPYNLYPPKSPFTFRQLCFMNNILNSHFQLENL